LIDDTKKQPPGEAKQPPTPHSKKKGWWGFWRHY